MDDRILARMELDEILGRCLTEQELGRAMDKVRMNYHPPGEGFSYREWLEKVQRYLRGHET